MDYNLINKRLSEVASIEALETTKADFLATHLPFKNLKFESKGLRLMDSDQLSEEDYFRQYIMETRDEHNFIIVKGDNGTGKSHLIRWLYYKYENEIDSNEEVVLIITRGQNTLKSTLQQIVNSDVFKDIEDTNEFKKLIEASDTLNEEELREQIAALIVAECNVEDEEDEKYLKKRHKRFLHSFLSDEVIREHILFKENGPIERIMSKLVYNPEIDNEKIEPRFYPEDFEIEYGGEILRKMKMKNERSSDRAIRMAEMLANEKTGFTLRVDISKYLNSKINKVIQSSIKIGKNDLKEIFAQIRTSLKEHNKSLTLFIEDITVFTGIDRELIEILLINHKNEKNSNLCRLTSIVGTTTEYYNDNFPDNVRDRVTNKIIIGEESLFTSEEDKCELVARYLNAIKLESKDLETWLKNGADDKLLPIKKSSLDSKWAEFKLKDGRTMSLYPFNKKAISNIYNGIKDKKSPRNFIRIIMLDILQDYTHNPKKFPPTEKEFSSIKFPVWKDALTEDRLKKEVPEDKLGQMDTILRLWGEAHINRDIIDGKVYIGGVPEEVFIHFDLPLITGIDKGDLGEITSEEENKPLITETRSDKKPELKDTRVVKEWEKFSEELRSWREGGILASHKWLRDELCDIIGNYFNWEEEGISPLFMKYFITTNYFHIEGQSVNIGRGFLMERNDESYYVLLALGLWRYMGNRSWDFLNSEDYIFRLTNYLNGNKEEILNIARYPDIENTAGWDYEGWALLNEFYLRMLNGELEQNQSLEDIYKTIFISDLDINVENIYGEVWESTVNRLKNDSDIDTHHGQIIRYYNLILGEANPETTPVHFLDVYEILNNLERLKDNNWIVDEGIGQYIGRESVSNYYFPLRLLKKYWLNQINKLAGEGEEELNLNLEELERQFGKEYNKENVDELNRMAEKFLDEILFDIHENYNPELFKPLRDKEYSGSEIIKFREEVISMEALDDIQKIILLSQKSNLNLNPYLSALNNLENLVDNINNRYKSKLKNEDKGDMEKLAEAKESINNTIEDMKRNISSVIGVDSYVGG